MKSMCYKFQENKEHICQAVKGFGIRSYSECTFFIPSKKRGRRPCAYESKVDSICENKEAVLLASMLNQDLKSLRENILNKQKS